ncbi:hypothetical protein DNTS_003636 [Danionella cerebrum]|uniref:BTB domain-containing protein n=1 Tax=Danionella cerebrum TaxID=2873325 RepID=A0A553NRK2_9TELE|nr:hypothetical protein DNTS_003636 [Danionella translucida]
MGSFGSRFQSSPRGPEEAIERPCSGNKRCECRKRKRSSHCQCESEPEEDDSTLDTPRRKKLKSTSKYIYQTLFLNGENSDIQIRALGQEWNLHKIYLCQSGYFSSMFSGSWKESNMMVIELEIPDQNIDAEALQVVFGSLYRDDVLIKPSRVVNILAAACMLQLDGLIQQCGETMKENVNVKSVCSYYNSATMYGLDSVMKKCLEWLLNNLMTNQNVELMKELGGEVMEQLIRSSDLFVMQVEMDVYTAMKKVDAGEVEPFLNTDDGVHFVPVFRHIRLQYIINDLASARMLERDNILPPDWLSAVYKQQWFAMLRTEHDNDNGPQEASKGEFELNSMRCGRKLTKDGDYCWRWTGFNYGFDLLVTYTNRFIIFKRNTLSQPCGGAVSLQPQRHLAYRLRLASFDSSGKVVCSRSTGYQLVTLEKDQEYVVMNLDSRLLSFPLYVCCNFLYTSPSTERQGDAPEPESSARNVSS